MFFLEHRKMSTGQNTKVQEISAFFDHKKAELTSQKSSLHETLKTKLASLVSDRKSLNPSEAMLLRNEARNFIKAAEYCEFLAEECEKGKLSEKRKVKNEEAVKETLMEELGIPAEFIELLGILVKAGPEALREAAELYRTQAKEKREEADKISKEAESIDKKIKTLQELMKSKNIDFDTDYEVLSRKIKDVSLLDAILRENAEESYKTMLEEADESS